MCISASEDDNKNICQFCNVGVLTESVIVRSRQTDSRYVVFRCSNMSCLKLHMIASEEIEDDTQ